MADNPWGVEAPITEATWSVLSRTETTLVFGQRTGAVGIGSVVTLTNRGGRWQPDTLGGCGTVVPPAGESSAVIESASLHGTDLRLTWLAGSCGGPDPDEVVVRTETEQTSDGLHVLIVTRPKKNRSRSGWCAGVGLSATVHVRLQHRLDQPVLWNDAKIPSERVMLDGA